MKINKNSINEKWVKNHKKFKLTKGKALASTALLVAFIATLAGCGKNKDDVKPVRIIGTHTIEELGDEIPFSIESLTQPKYGDTTGDVDVNKVVRGSDGKIYATKEDADKSNDVGKVTYDTRNGELEVTPDGNVKDPNATGNVVKDPNGNVVSSGDTAIPEGYYEASNGDIIPIGYVYSPATYYGPDGNVAIQKGDLVSEEDLAYAKAHFSTTKPVKQDSPVTTTKPAKQDNPVTTAPTTQPSTDDKYYAIVNGELRVFDSEEDFNNYINSTSTVEPVKQR